MAVTLSVVGDIDEAPWADIDGCPFGTLVRVGGLPNATDTGRPIVAVAVQFEDGTWAIGQTTMRNFLMAADFLRAKYEGQL